MALAEMGLGLNGIQGLNGYWQNWELDQVALDEMGLDKVAIPRKIIFMIKYSEAHCLRSSKVA